MKCIVLAGGFATRLWPLTENKAKPLLHLKDRPLISHIVENIPKNIDIIISTNAVFEEAFREWAKEFKDRDLTIFVEDSMEDDFKKGALGATAYVIEEKGIKEDLLLLAGDNYFGFSIEAFLEKFKGNPLLAAYDIKKPEAAKKFGVVVKREGKVFEFQEKPQHPKSTLVSTGCFAFPQKNLKDIIDYAKEKNDDLGGVFEYLLKKKVDIDVFTFEEKWIDIGSFEAYLKGNIDLLEGKIMQREGVKNKNSRLSGSVFLGKDSLIEDCLIENSVILQNCHLSNCVIRNCVIDEGSQLRNLDISHKMIRQGSRIEKS